MQKAKVKQSLGFSFKITHFLWPWTQDRLRMDHFPYLIGCATSKRALFPHFPYMRQELVNIQTCAWPMHTFQLPPSPMHTFQGHPSPPVDKSNNFWVIKAKRVTWKMCLGEVGTWKVCIGEGRELEVVNIFSTIRHFCWGDIWCPIVQLRFEKNSDMVLCFPWRITQIVILCKKKQLNYNSTFLLERHPVPARATTVWEKYKKFWYGSLLSVT